MARAGQHLTPWLQQQVEARPRGSSRGAKRFAQQPAQAIALGRRPQRPRQHHAQAIASAAVLEGQHQEQAPVQAQPLAQHPPEVPRRVQAVRRA
jgi:hypothetical protein